MLNYLVGSHNNSRGRQWHPTPVLLPGKSHGLRSLVGCSPWGLEESDTTERLHFLQATHSSVLAWRIPGRGGVSWAAIYGVAQSRTRLKQLSSSSSMANSEAGNTFCVLCRPLYTDADTSSLIKQLRSFINSSAVQAPPGLTNGVTAHPPFFFINPLCCPTNLGAF